MKAVNGNSPELIPPELHVEQPQGFKFIQGSSYRSRSAAASVREFGL
jgi:hypothetical protein